MLQHRLCASRAFAPLRVGVQSPNAGQGSISIPLPEGYSSFTIVYGQACYAADARVVVQLNGVEHSYLDSTCAAGTGAGCYTYPPPDSCIDAYTGSYAAGDTLELRETGTSIGYIISVALDAVPLPPPSSPSPPSLAPFVIDNLDIINTQNVTLGAELPVVPDGSVLTEVTGTVNITENQQLESLGTALGDIEDIGLSLEITDNPALETIDTFNVLASVGNSINIVVNAALTSISGFGSLETVGSFVQIVQNTNLLTITGFPELVGITGANGLEIFSNAALTSVSGFGSLETSGDVTIGNNPLLTSIVGLGNLTTVNGNLDIQANAVLPNLDELTSLTAVGGDCIVSPPNLLTNAPQNVRTACGLP